MTKKHFPGFLQVHRKIIYEKSFSLGFAGFCALVAAYLVFLGVISISTGLQHTQEEGSWMPVLAGSLCILAVLWIFFRVARSLVRP